MKCPVCGTENKSTSLACYRCGSPLTQETPPSPSKTAAQELWKKDKKAEKKKPLPPSPSISKNLTALDDEAD
ncbi:MAG: zinc finger protein, partial [Eubacteriales bacterium]|nr:zinc finger protein [Eubacteriales bacterium]